MNNLQSLAFSTRNANSNWDNNNTFPEFVYLDTNPIINIMDQGRHSESDTEYIKELFSKGGIIAWSHHTEQELRNHIHVNEYMRYARDNHALLLSQRSHGNTPLWKIAEDKVSNEVSKQIAINVHDQAESVFDELRNYGFLLDGKEFCTNEVVELTRYIYSRCGGSEKDAKHIAFANLYGINNIFSHDAGMLRYHFQNVFGASNGVVNNCINGQAPLNFTSFKELMINEKKE